MKKFVAGTLAACMLMSGTALAKANVNTTNTEGQTKCIFVNRNGQCQKLPYRFVFKCWKFGSSNPQAPEITIPEQPDTEVPEITVPSQPEPETPVTPETPSEPETPVVPEKPAEPDTENPGVQAPETENSYAQQVLTLVNQERAKYGLSALVLDETLNAVAYAHSKDMSDRNYFSHTNPDGLSPFDRMKANGVSYRTAAENIAVGQKTPAQVVDSWMNSEGHRKNILNGNFNKMGIGLYQSKSGYKYYWTQCFTD